MNAMNSSVVENCRDGNSISCYWNVIICHDRPITCNFMPCLQSSTLCWNRPVLHIPKGSIELHSHQIFRVHRLHHQRYLDIAYQPTVAKHDATWFCLATSHFDIILSPSAGYIICTASTAFSQQHQLPSILPCIFYVKIRQSLHAHVFIYGPYPLQDGFIHAV